MDNENRRNMNEFCNLLRYLFSLASGFHQPHLITASVYLFTILVMRGAIGAKIGVFELFQEQPAHHEALEQRPWQLFISPAFISALMLSVWIGLTLGFLGLNPFSISDTPPPTPVAFIGFQLLFSGGASYLGRKPPSTSERTTDPIPKGELVRRSVGILAGIVLTVITLWIIQQAAIAISRHTCFNAHHVTMVLPVILAAICFFIASRWNWLLTCAAWFMLLILLTTAAAALSVLPLLPALLAAGGVFIITAARITRFRYRIPGIPSGCYDQPISTLACSTAPMAPLISPRTVLDAWATQTKPDHSTKDNITKPKLVLVAASGGAYRATFWTAAVLDALARYDHDYKTAAQKHADTGDHLNGLMSSVRFITGASGGMVAGAYLAEQSALVAKASSVTVPDLNTMITDDIAAYQKGSVAPPDMEKPRKRQIPVPRDSLAPIAWQILQDLRHMLRKGPTLQERGRVLESQWSTLMKPFHTVNAEEAKGIRPSLIFSPMLVESGAPIFISNLELKETRTHFANEPVDQHSAELFRILPESHYGNTTGSVPDPSEGLTIATATRLAATFPYFSPAVSLPTSPHRRVVDAGYYDNYGIDIATSLLNSKTVREWVVRNCSGVLILATRAFPDGQGTREASKYKRLFWWITSPLSGFLTSRGSSQTFRNREQLRLTRELYGLALSEANPNTCPPKPWRVMGQDFIEIVTFVYDQEATMSWQLSETDHKRIASKAAIETAAGQPDMVRLFNFWNKQPIIIPAPRNTTSALRSC